MQFLKVSCSQCARYHECPQKTRMYVNYCGSCSKQMKENIREAMLDCRARQGGLFKRTLISESQISTHSELAAPVSP